MKGYKVGKRLGSLCSLSLMVFFHILCSDVHAAPLTPSGNLLLESHTADGDFTVTFTLESLQGTTLDFAVSGAGSAIPDFVWQLVVVPIEPATVEVTSALLDDLDNIDGSSVEANLNLPVAADSLFRAVDNTFPWSFHWEITFTSLPAELLLAFETFSLADPLTQLGSDVAVAELRPVPEPGPWLYISSGLLALLLLGYRRQRLV